jgi:hypothetical protein
MLTNMRGKHYEVSKTANDGARTGLMSPEALTAALRCLLGPGIKEGEAVDLSNHWVPRFTETDGFNRPAIADARGGTPAPTTTQVPKRKA